MLVKFAAFISKINETLYSFISGIAVSLGMNVFTTLLYSENGFTCYNVIAIILVIISSAIWLLITTYAGEFRKSINTAGAKSAKLTIKDHLEKKNIKKMVYIIGGLCFAAVAFFCISLVLLYKDHIYWRNQS